MGDGHSCRMSKHHTPHPFLSPSLPASLVKDGWWLVDPPPEQGRIIALPSGAERNRRIARLRAGRRSS